MSSHNILMSKTKFATKLERDVLSELRAYSKESKIPIAEIVSTAVAEHLRLVRIRPAFKSAVEVVLNENQVLLKRLAE